MNYRCLYIKKTKNSKNEIAVRAISFSLFFGHVSENGNLVTSAVNNGCYPNC